MPTAKESLEQPLGQLLCEMGPAGAGKSQFAMQAPQPHAILCVDKPVIATPPTGFPGYDPALSFGKFYPPPAKDLTDDKQKPSRNVFDQIIKDIEALKVALYKGDASFKMGVETWLLPKSIIIEGMDFIRDHCVDWTLNTQGKFHMDEFVTADGRPNLFLGWGLVAQKMAELFQNLAFLPSVRPVNVIVTLGLDEEQKRQSVNGKMEVLKTGFFDPAFGGKMAVEAPRKFRDCWLATKEAGKYWMVTSETAKYAKYRGLRSGKFGLQTVEDVTIDPLKPVNHWTRLFG